MDFRFTEEEETFRQEVREWLKQEIPQRWLELDPIFWEETEESWMLSRQFQRKLGHKGWLAPAYPKEYGGLELSHTKRLVLAEELAYNRAPISVEVEISVNWVGPALMLFGTEEQKGKYVTGVAKGDIIFCLGYSEPNAGSDLASLQTRAVESGDYYVINGQKIWASYAHYADYCWLAARTDTDAPKHKGISMILVDMKTPGITIRPLINILNRHSFNEVFFDDVRVTKTNLVGQKNNGWYQLAMALDFERSSIGYAAANQRIIEELVHYAKETKYNGKPLADDPLIKNELANIAVENEIARMMNYRIAWMYSKGMHPSYESSMSMVFTSEVTRHVANAGMKILGHYGELDQDSKWAVMNARFMRMCLCSLSIGLGGGTNEIQRNIIAIRGLGLPRH
ncbi:MAG: acyl-CoA dehydrogenase [Chloroflexi bacterium]|nr:acyl-CoA dehydrogenase [Chloroflexota bacterium]MBM3154173.1 acyl-CoA dehydrogenase [Chloroflexota bacterium]MBM3172957.1 acyl-CoA dehydrogenase [Chloroflexota bacterium]MBM3175840.1 acyl-CoA dehydrogenase [Chloroflexota bacterium]MBM4450285.1 acyl-CoA dehydrogenase [Chloroflexota bacterium]